MRDGTRTDWHARVDRAVRNMLDCLDRPTELSRIAAAAAASPWHFQRMFLTLTGETPDDCLRRLRMERAAFLLRRPGCRVIDAALDSGYDSPEAFTKAFVRAWGLRPRELRRLPDWQGSLPSPAGIHYHPDGRERWCFVTPERGADMQAKIVMFEERRVVGLAVEGDPWHLPEAWSRLTGLLCAEGLDVRARAWLSLFPPSGAAFDRFAAAVALPEPGAGGPPCPPALQEWRLPGGLCAVVVHFGSSEEIGATVERWEKDWLPGSSWEADPNRPRWEWYQNRDVPPELQLTFWIAPVRRATV